MGTRKILWAILGIYMVISIAAVSGAAVETTTETLTPENDIITEEIPEIEPYTTTSNNECICNCENQNPVVECAEKVQEDNNQLDLNENPTMESVTVVGTESADDSKSPSLEPELTTVNAINDEDIKSETTETNVNKRETTTLPPPPLCSTPGLRPHESNCQAFNDCTAADSADGSLRLITRFCAPNHAFNVEFGACGRDISTCTNPVVCLAKGTIPDPSSNTSYYLCEPRLIGGGFHVFHVMCSENEIFYPTLGQCYLDFKNLNLQPLPPYYNWNQIEDIDLVKAELKVIKENDKLKLKVEKEKLKAEKKLQKEAAKEAERLAKEQEKLLKEQVKQESELFICPQAGNYPSTLSETTYFSCTLKKTTLKKAIRKCITGSKFDAVSGMCVMDPNAPRVIETEEDDD